METHSLKSIVYITSRIQPMVRWFTDSLAYQSSQAEKDNDLEIIFVDLLLDSPNADDRRKIFESAVDGRFKFKHVPPKPNVWQGKDRVTSTDWFAASNARNTGLVHADGEHIAFVDDLSVLTGTWFLALKEAALSGKVTCGSYMKVKSLRVDNGNITHFEKYPGGEDNRYRYGNDSGPVPCGGNWLYGCSFTLPTQWLIDANGSDEACDGMGFEDCILGIRLANRGHHFQYDRRLMSYEAEELHHLDQIMRRPDKGVSPNDTSHAILHLANRTSRAENVHLGPDGIIGLRRVLRETGEIPLPDGPSHDWYDGQPICEMT